MKRFMILGFAALMAVSCSQSNTATVQAQINGANNKDIVISQLAVNQVKPLDTVRTGATGALKCNVVAQESPNFYYLSYNGKRLASLVLKAGDKVKVTADTLGNDVVIEGSEESVLLAKYDSELAASVAEFEALSAKFVEAFDAGNTEEAQQLNAQLSKVYVKHKQSVIKSIMQNPYSFANIQAVYQNFSQGLPVFGDRNDFLLLKRVHDSLQRVYPNSVYVKSMQEQINEAEKLNAFEHQLSKAGETSFPNITLPDINAKDVELASLEGKPFILMFWTAADANLKMFNNDLKEIYSKYHPAGLEIYQVSVDTDKTAWATTVKEQELPWISVCDGKGAASPAVITYNVYNIPSVFVFAKNGDIVASGALATKAKMEEAVKKAIK